MNKKELMLKETPLPEGFQCIDCDLYSFCSNELDISNMFDKNCKFSPSKFKCKKKINNSCVFYNRGRVDYNSYHINKPNVCKYFGTEGDDINCYKCKVYVNEYDAIPKLVNYIKDELKNKCNQSKNEED